MTALHGKNIIGAETSAAGSTTFRGTDPSRSLELDTDFVGATPEEIDRAFDLALQACDELRRKSPDAIAAFLEATADEILELGEALIERCGLETGLPQARLIGERGRTVGQLRAFASVVREGSWLEAHIDHAIPDRQPVPKPDARRMLVPIGPVVVFGASNFPLAFSVAGGDTASALAAGNPVLVKANRAHPGTSELVGRAIQSAAAKTDMPTGIFSLLHGSGTKVGGAMVRHPAARAVGFTGSLRGGRELFDIAAARPDPIPVYAEMGSVNPVFLLPGALAERGADIAAGLQQSVTLGVGQFCTNPGMVVGVAGESLDGFADALRASIESSAPGTMLHDGIRDAYEGGLGRLESHVSVTVAARATATIERDKTQAAACVLATSASALLTDRELSEEVFGPSTLLVSCASRDELIAVASGLDGHLTATVHGTPADLEAHGALLRILETKVGRIVINGFPTGVEVCPSMHHGGPYPATTNSLHTSVGATAIRRFARPICYQGFPDSALPPELREGNPRGIWRRVDGELARD